MLPLNASRTDGLLEHRSAIGDTPELHGNFSECEAQSMVNTSECFGDSSSADDMMQTVFLRSAESLKNTKHSDFVPDN